MSIPPGTTVTSTQKQGNLDVTAIIDNDEKAANNITALGTPPVAASQASNIHQNPANPVANIPPLSRKDKWLVGLAVLAQGTGIAAIVASRSKPELVVVWEGGAIAAATFFMGFTTTTKAVFWNWLFAAVNLIIIGSAWYLATHP